MVRHANSFGFGQFSPLRLRPRFPSLPVMSKTALGRGLGALLSGGTGGLKPPSSAASPGAGASTAGSPPTDTTVRSLSLDQIRPSPLQPRRDFSQESLQDLANSLQEQGVVQPLIVRNQGDHFELIAGERRWRAAKLAGLSEVPVIERVASDREVLELALIENLQRENLNPIEEAMGYQQLIDQFHLRQEDVAQKVGKSRTVVANALRLLKLNPVVLSAVREGRLSVGHAKVLMGLSNLESQAITAEKILSAGLSVRQTEELVARVQSSTTSTSASSTGTAVPPNVPRDPHVVDLENKFCERFGTKVTVRYRQGRGSVEIRFYSDNDLDRLLQIVGVNPD